MARKRHYHESAHDKKVHRENLMHGRKKHHSHHSDSGYGMRHDGRHLEGHEMEPHNMRRGSLMSEDPSNPCGLPYGAHARAVDRHPNMGLAAHPNDLFLGVEEKMKADFEGVRRLMRPTNW